MKCVFCVLALFMAPRLAFSDPLPLLTPPEPGVMYGPNGQSYQSYSTPSGSVVYGPDNKRLDVYTKPDGGSVGYDQNGQRVFESYPSLSLPTPSPFAHP